MAGEFKYVYEFNPLRVDGHDGLKDLLGEKGAGLAEMCRAGLPVPPGFTISTEACRLFYRDPERYRGEVWPEVTKALEGLEQVSGKRFADLNNPLLVSVRSGARCSMPGMMDTVLNIGLNDESAKRLSERSADPRFAYDCYLRLLEMFGDIVLGIPIRRFERAYAGDQQAHCEDFKEIIESGSKTFPQDPREQLRMAIEAVFRSWNNPRAITYRQLNDIPDDLGTAVTIQAMVFGNLGRSSGTGVGFTRHPSSGEPKVYGDFLPQAQGEDVLAKGRTPLGLDRLEQTLPETYEQLKEAAKRLEHHHAEMQEFEFTVEEGQVYLLQTHAGKRTGHAAVRIALDMHREGVMDRDEALLRVKPEELAQLLHPVFKETAQAEIVALGLPASSGAAVGRIVFSADEAVRRTLEGESIILVRSETAPDDMHGMEAAEGILTARGGMTSHAAVVARGLGKCCVVGCEALVIDAERRELRVRDKILRESDFISVDGSNGRVMLGKVEKIAADIERGLFTEYMRLLEGVSTLAVRANVDAVRDIKTARRFGAAGIGLCRTEHMFFAPERLPLMREMILAQSERERSRLLEQLKKFQKEDFLGILEEMDGLPVTVRLLDPPLHEFLPSKEELRTEIESLRGQGARAAELVKKERLLSRTEELEEVNPMLGHRGCRLGISFPEITRMQLEALFEAACELKKGGGTPQVEVMIPLVSLVEEFQDQARLTREVAQQVMSASGVDCPYVIGTMIELPRAALIADQIARYSDFFSFGTNDLTQTTFGFSRDDAGRFVKIYQEKGILRWDPFQVLDQQGVGELIRIAVEKGRRVRRDLKLGFCGEHGGDPAAIRFCYDLGIDYVSCTPHRVPVARLAAAQAALLGRRTDPSRPRASGEARQAPFPAV